MSRMNPGVALQAHVSGYVDYDMVGWPPGVHRGLPDGSVNLVVNLDAPVTVRRAGRADVATVATVAGLTADPVDIVHGGCERGIQLQLTPLGAREVLGVRAADLADGVYSLDDVVGRRADELVGRLAEAGSAGERAAVIDVVLTGWLAEDDPPPAVATTWHHLVASAGAMPIGLLATEVGLSRRHLGQLVVDELGVTPKTIARVLRFVHARELLTAGGGNAGRGRGLADVAVACGYFDQAHLANEWKRLAGCTPGEWMAEELPFLQDRRPTQDRR